MKSGKVTIKTKADDGAEITAVFPANIELSENETKVTYVDQGSFVSLILKNGELLIERTGDYVFSLRLAQGKELPASLGIAGATGDIKTFTDFINYSTTEKSFSASVKYFLIFAGGERQEMKIRLTARVES